MENSKTVTSFYYSENPNGLRYHEISNSMCRLYVIHRTLLPVIKGIEELQTAALYILLGENENREKKAYIGQTTNASNRLGDHASKKDFWECAFVIVAKDGKSFSSTTIQYLEHLAITKVNYDYSLSENNTIPKSPKLSTHEQSDIENYFSDIEFLVEHAGCNIFKTITPQTNEKKYELLYLTVGARDAKGYYDENGFTVLKGSKLTKKSQTLNYNWEYDRNKLIKKYTEEIGDGLCILKESLTFKSPSRAASFITGTSVNGLTSWKDKDGNTLGSKSYFTQSR